MAEQSYVQAVIGVSGFRAESDGVGVTGERFVRIDLPRTITEEHVTLMQKDLASLAEIAERHPEDMTALQNAVVRHDFHAATQLAEKVGLTEEQLVGRGGGQVGLALGILAGLVVLSLIMSSSSGSGDSPPPTPPSSGDLDGGLPPEGVPTS